MLILTSKNHGENAISGTAYYPMVNIKSLSCKAKDIEQEGHNGKVFWLVGYFRLFIVATSCPSERSRQKIISGYGG